MKGDGWIQRYGLMIYPDLSNTFTVNKTAENLNVRGAMDALIVQLCKLRDEEMRVVQFDPDAQAMYEAWLVPLMNRQRFSDENPALITHFTKYQSLMPQLALVLEIGRNPGADYVTAESTELALRWVTEYLDKHAKRVYSLPRAGGESAYVLAVAIQERKLGSHFTTRDVRQKHWRRLASDGEINDAIDALTEWGWLRVAEASGVGRPTTKYVINPKLID
jgi:putative DNA primase/helicase